MTNLCRFYQVLIKGLCIKEVITIVFSLFNFVNFYNSFINMYTQQEMALR